METTNLNGEVTADIQATLGLAGSPASVQWVAAAGAATEVELPASVTPQSLFGAGGIGAPPQSSYTAWTTYQYSHTHLVSTRAYYDIADGLYNTTTYGYENDGQGWMGRRVETISPDGDVTWNVLDAEGDVLSTWEGTGTPAAYNSPGMTEVSSSAYDADGNEISSTQYVAVGVGNTTQYVYDWQDRQIVAIDPQDSQGRVTYTLTQYDNEGNAVETQHYWYRDVAANLPGYIQAAQGENSPAKLYTGDTLLSQSATAYDSLGEPYQTTDYFVVNGTAGPASTAETSSAWYDADGNEVKAEDPLGNLTTYGYGASDEQTSVTQPAAQAGSAQPVTQTIYDPDGNVTATIDPLGNVTATTYNGVDQDVADYQGQVIEAGDTGYSTVTADGITDDTWTFSSLSPSKVTAANASCYDIYVSAGTTAGPSINNATAVNPGDQSAPWLGSQWQFWGTVELLSSSTPFVSVTYASGGRPQAVCLLQQTSASAYDAAGNVSSRTDALGNFTTYAYDNLGQKIETAEPNAPGSPATQTIYDGDGDVTATVDPLGRVTASTYDQYGNVTDTYQGQIAASLTRPARGRSATSRSARNATVLRRLRQRRLGPVLRRLSGHGRKLYHDGQCGSGRCRWASTGCS